MAYSGEIKETPFIKQKKQKCEVYRGFKILKNKGPLVKRCEKDKMDCPLAIPEQQCEYWLEV